METYHKREILENIYYSNNKNKNPLNPLLLHSPIPCSSISNKTNPFPHPEKTLVFLRCLFDLISMPLFHIHLWTCTTSRFSLPWKDYHSILTCGSGGKNGEDTRKGVYFLARLRSGYTKGQPKLRIQRKVYTNSSSVEPKF